MRTNAYTSYSQGRWTGGPVVEVRLPYRFAVEFNALFRSYRQNTAYSMQFGPNLNPYLFTGNSRTNAWDLPLLLKYRLRVGQLRPFLSAGYQWTREDSETTALFTCSGTQGSCKPAEFPQEVRGGFFRSTSTPHGPVVGAGLEFKTRYVTIAPEFRFSRATNGYPRENRATGLVGFTFGRTR